MKRQTMLAILVAAMIVNSPCYASPSVGGSVTIRDQNGHSKSDSSGVIVFLDDLENAPALAVPQERPKMRQANKKFNPETLPVLAGTTVDFPNDDRIFHNVFSLSRAKPVDLGIYGQGVVKSVLFDKPGLVKMYCNIHPNMVGYVLVLANPYFTQTDSQGRFVIPNAPLGKAVVRFWYSRTRDQTEQEIHVTEKGVQDLHFNLVEGVRFEIQEEVIPIQHKNKLGQEYPARY